LAVWDFWVSAGSLEFKFGLTAREYPGAPGQAARDAESAEEDAEKNVGHRWESDEDGINAGE
jgi:hypothetical protein